MMTRRWLQLLEALAFDLSSNTAEQIAEQLIRDNRPIDQAMRYQLERFLMSIDNGWVNRRAQYYRGAVQVEDVKWDGHVSSSGTSTSSPSLDAT